jgi:hypothetical protein
VDLEEAETGKERKKRVWYLDIFQCKATNNSSSSSSSLLHAAFLAAYMLWGKMQGLADIDSLNLRHSNAQISYSLFPFPTLMLYVKEKLDNYAFFISCLYLSTLSCVVNAHFACLSCGYFVVVLFHAAGGIWSPLNLLFKRPRHLPKTTKTLTPDEH